MIFLIVVLSFGSLALGLCPDKQTGLKRWSPGQQTSRSYVIGRGQKLLLTSSAEFKRIEIKDGGMLVFQDTPGKKLTLTVGGLWLHSGGGLHIGSEDCVYKGFANIRLKGKSTDSDKHPDFGHKFIGVGKGGILEIHGQKKTSWTQLIRTISPGTKPYDSRNTYRRGINVFLLDGQNGNFIEAKYFDTYEKHEDVRSLLSYLRAIPKGRIVSLLTYDEASNKLTDDVRKEIEYLGAKQIGQLSFRDSYVLIAKKGTPLLTKESLVPYSLRTGKAEAQYKVDNVRGSFIVHAFSAWMHPTLHRYETRLRVIPQEVSRTIYLKDDVSSWQPGDRIVIASTDFDMEQAEEFTIEDCNNCRSNQIRMRGMIKYEHFGRIDRAVDMRAEVGLLTRNIVIEGLMESKCYGNNWCQYFSFDTYGGHIKVLRGFGSVHLEGAELTKMGQQQLGFYPVHFHMCSDVDQKGGYTKPTFVKDLSIHHSYSRCVTIHGTNGLLVENTVGYDHLGHCFFLEDGAEQRNTLKHNLGLLTKYGTILPSDRSYEMCQKITDKVWPGYKPTYGDCAGLSTFWITHPNNNLINNAAAGSKFRGIWYIFHRSPSGLSAGSLPWLHGEQSPMGINQGNRAHSNGNDGFFLDGGVKITPASASKPKEYLSISFARYKPHQDSDLKKPRVPARIKQLTAFKNRMRGVWVRGGDIFFEKPRFADNAISCTLASEGAYPNDPGSHQEVSDGIFIGESGNRGSPGTSYNWFPADDGRDRSYPAAQHFPIRGFEIYDGPVICKRCTFYDYKHSSKYEASAIGFFLNNNWQMATTSYSEGIKLINSRPVYGGKDGGYFGKRDKDGEKIYTFHDKDGSLTGVAGSRMFRPDNGVAVHSGCVLHNDWAVSLCKGRYVTTFIHTNSRASLVLTRDSNPSKPLLLNSPSSTADNRYFMPNLLADESYTLHWQRATPSKVNYILINFEQNDWVEFGVCTASGSNVKNVHFQNYKVFRRLNAVSSHKELSQRINSGYYHDKSTGMVFVRFRAEHNRDGYNFCSVQGCEQIIVEMDRGSDSASDCRAKVYPKYQKAEPKRISILPSALVG